MIAATASNRSANPGNVGLPLSHSNSFTGKDPLEAAAIFA